VLETAASELSAALDQAELPVLTASDCSICIATLPTVAARVPDLRFLWIDAHGDFNSPATTPSGFLGGMCLAGACGRWEPGLDVGALDPAQVVLAGTRELDGGELAELDFAGVARVERPAEVADSVDSADVFVHLDLDVLDPEIYPAGFPVAGGLSDAGLRRLLDEVSQAAERVVGVEVTGCDGPEDAAERGRLAGLAADAVTPLLTAMV
jgi:arginase family enzyme